MKYVVTGGNGFIGSSLIKKLAKEEDCAEIRAVVRKGSYNERLPKNSKIRIFEYDGTAESLKDAVSGAHRAVHLGALFSTKGDLSTVNSILRDNVTFSVHLLHTIGEREPSMGVAAASTFSSYDGLGLYSPNSFYDASKKAVEDLSAGLQVRAAFLRVTDTYGPGDWRPKVHNILRDAVLNGDREFAFMKPSAQPICLNHVGDVCDALLMAAELAASYERTETQSYSLLTPQNCLTLGEVASLITSGSETIVKFGSEGAMELPPPLNPLEFEAKHSLKDSLHSTLFDHKDGHQ